MRKYIKISLLLMVSVTQIICAERLYGLDRLDQVDQLPLLLKGTRAWQVSSRDRTGGNDDGFNTNYSALYTDVNGEPVIFDETVPGCVYRIWTACPSTVRDSLFLNFYFDGESQPSLRLSVRELFQGDNAPFLNPMVGDRWFSSGGYYSYYPLPYANRLKITLSSMPSIFYYNITYHRFDSADGIQTWTNSVNVDAGIQMLESIAEDPKPTNGNMRVVGTANIPAGEVFQLYSNAGPGVVQSLKFDFGSLPLTQLNDMQIVMKWDGGAAEVAAPLDEFFAYKAGGMDVRSLPLGMSSDGTAYCYFPMPFWERAEISIQNNTGLPVSNVTYELQIGSNSFNQAETGCFHADHRKATFGSDGRDFCYLDVAGRGHFVGVSIFMDATGSGTSYLEGDERIYIDGALTPPIQGTGAEDYFNGGWYFDQGVFSLPYHGCPYKENGNVSAYRLHMTDVIPFEKSIKAGIEHGTGNGSGGTFSSVAYYYLAKQQTSGLALVADLDLRDSWSEALYDYDLPSFTNVSGAWYYEGDDDNILLADEGYTFSGEVATFTVPLTEDNVGLLLRRRTDQKTAGQKALVFVDDDLAGTWFEPDANFHSSNKRWLDSEYMVPLELVAGKTVVQLRIIPLSSSPQWNEYHYWAYCIKPYTMFIDSDGDLIPDDWELDRVVSLDLMDGTADPDRDGSTDYEEYVSGTDPDDPASCLRLGNDLTFDSKVGHLYQLEECSSLLSNDWKTVRENIPGIGGLMQLPPETVNASGPTAFRRLRVERQ